MGKTAIDVACVAGGIVSTCKIKFWQRSQQVRGEENENFILRAPTILPRCQPNRQLFRLQ